MGQLRGPRGFPLMPEFVICERDLGRPGGAHRELPRLNAVVRAELDLPAGKRSAAFPAHAGNRIFQLMRDPEACALMLTERKIAEVPVTVHVFYGHRIALQRGTPYLAGKWEDVTRCESFEWKTKRNPNRGGH